MRTALYLAALLCASIATNRADWRQFRGQNTTGIADQAVLPTKLTEKNIAWTAALPGRGLSSPIVIGNRVFVTCSSGTKQNRLHVFCFNSETGEKIWERQFWATGRTLCQETTSVAAPSPASDGTRIFANFSSNDLVCLDLDGNLLWLRGLMLDYPNASNGLGMASSLLVTDGVLVTMLENDSQSLTIGVDVATGKTLWKLDRPNMANWTSPFVVRDAKGTATGVGLQSGRGVLCVDPKTGAEIWNYKDGASTIPSGTASDGVVYVPSFGITALQPQPGAAPTQLWRAAQLRPATASPVVVNRKVFVLNDAGVLSAGDAANGNRLWQVRLKGPFSATPVGADGCLYCVNQKGLLQVVDTKPTEGALLSELPLDDTILSTPAISGNALYIRSDAKLWKVANPR